MIPWHAGATQGHSDGQYFSFTVKHSLRAIDPVTALFNELMLLPQEGGSRQVSRKTGRNRRNQLNDLLMDVFFVISFITDNSRREI